MVDKQTPKVVIIGGGFGGLQTAMHLKHAPVDVTLIDRHNYHLFQPLLYQVATGGLSPANIATPLRYLLSKQKNCDVLMGSVVDIDFEKKCVITHNAEVYYDTLVVAAGSRTSYFGNDEWEERSPGLKTIDNALEIRKRIFSAYEAADQQTDPEQQKRLMTFVIVGGGPTGVELAGAIAEIARHTLKHNFRHILPEQSHIMIVEAAPHILSHYPEELCQKARRLVESFHIDVRTHTKVKEIQDHYLIVDTPEGEERIECCNVIWAAGVCANPLGKLVADAHQLQTDRGGRVPVSAKLTVENSDHVYVIGDLASCKDGEGKACPGLAPVAMQQGEYVAKRIRAFYEHKPFEKEFVYKDKGTMATIGRAAAVAKVGSYETAGFIAWILWLFIHLAQIIQVQNRLLILTQWAWHYLTFNQSARIITGYDDQQLPK